MVGSASIETSDEDLGAPVADAVRAALVEVKRIRLPLRAREEIDPVDQHHRLIQPNVGDRHGLAREGLSFSMQRVEK